MSGQRRHESPELGDAIARMMRGLVTRAAEGDTEAVEQLQRISQLAPIGLRLGVQQAHEFGYSWAELGAVLNSTRQNAQQLGNSLNPEGMAGRQRLGIGHVLVPGHDKRTCPDCAGDTPATAAEAPAAVGCGR